jgi:hypothetical protein
MISAARFDVRECDGVVERCQIPGNSLARLFQHIQSHRLIEMKPLGIAHGPHVDTELAIDLTTTAERKLRAAAAGIENDQGTLCQPRC